jgi:hypothetical protein
MHFDRVHICSLQGSTSIFFSSSYNVQYMASRRLRTSNLSTNLEFVSRNFGVVIKATLPNFSFIVFSLCCITPCYICQRHP